jgi:glutamyl-tRNA reductase
VDRMLARLKVQEIAPVIVSLQEQLETIRSAEVLKALRKGGALGEREVEALTRAIVAKIAHGPIAELRRQAGEAEGGAVVEVERRVFGID